MAECNSTGCTLSQHEQMKARPDDPAPSMEIYERRLSLYERS